MIVYYPQYKMHKILSIIRNYRILRIVWANFGNEGWLHYYEIEFSKDEDALYFKLKFGV
jgi:hypothetical protein